MGTDTILFTSLLLTLIILIVGQYILFKSRKKQKEEYPKLWEKFQNLEVKLKVPKVRHIFSQGRKSLVYRNKIHVEPNT